MKPYRLGHDVCCMVAAVHDHPLMSSQSVRALIWLRDHSGVIPRARIK